MASVSIKSGETLIIEGAPDLSVPEVVNSNEAPVESRPGQRRFIRTNLYDKLSLITNVKSGPDLRETTAARYSRVYQMKTFFFNGTKSVPRIISYRHELSIQAFV